MAIRKLVPQNIALFENILEVLQQEVVLHPTDQTQYDKLARNITMRIEEDFTVSQKVPPRKLSTISNDEAKAMLDEHIAKPASEGWLCGCDRCIVLNGLLRERGVV